MMVTRNSQFALRSLLYTLAPTYYRNGTHTSSCLDLDNSRNFVFAHSLWRAFGAFGRPKGVWENLTCGTFKISSYNDVILTISSRIMSHVIYNLSIFMSFSKCKSLLVSCLPFDELASVVATSCIWIILSVVNRDGSSNTTRMPRSLPWTAWSEFFLSCLSLFAFPIPGGVWFFTPLYSNMFLSEMPKNRCYTEAPLSDKDLQL